MSLLLVSLTINGHVHIEGEMSPAAFPSRVNCTDVDPTVAPLDLRQFSHRANVWHFLNPHGNAIRCFPGDFGDGRVRINFSNQTQGAALKNSWSRIDSDCR